MERLARLAAAHGVSTSYEPAPGSVVDVPDETVVAVLAALGVDAATPRAVREALAQHEQDARSLLPPTVVLRVPSGAGTLPDLPDGTALRVETADGQPLDRGPATALPLGSHTLRAQAADGRTAQATLLVVPDRVPAPPGRAHDGAAAHDGRSAGLLTLLPSLLSARSWGIGDLGDLTDLADWAGRSLGAGFLQLGPLHAAVPGRPTDPSPYRPSSRRFPDPVHLRVEAVPEFAQLEGPERDRATALLTRAAALREAVLDKGELIDRDAAWQLKLEALRLTRHVPLSPGRRAAYGDFLAEQGQALEDHATWCALAELHGPDWRSWPAGLDDPRSARTARARAEHLDRVDFHSWLAWLTDTQLAHAQHTARTAGMPIGLVHDLAIGVHPHGADSWAQQHAFARRMSIGAPPDAFNAHGQDWGLPPWRPDALAAAGYAPYREVVAGLLRHAGALRIDHVMGHFRLWWVPEGRPPTEGAYVRYDAEAMLGALALEAHRAEAAVIGEDLGTVEDGVREELASRGILGTSVLWFERDWAAPPADAASTGDGSPTSPPPPLPPQAWRADCLATVTTHDLPPTASRLTGGHVALRHGLGLLDGSLAAEQSADRVETDGWLACFRDLGLLPEGADDPAAALHAAHRFLARTPARMVGVWLPDAVGDHRPQNVPGTCDEYPNWRLPVADADGTPVCLERLAAAPRVHALFAELRAGLGR
jgi:4-alpha-glucanotransferase